MNASEFVSRLGTDARPTHDGNGSWSCRCPAHEDGKASLSVDDRDGGGVLVHCHAGCTADAVVGAIGLKLADLMPPREVAAGAKVKHSGAGRIVATYDYRDEAGGLLYQVCRMDPKNFRQRQPAGDGWLWKMDGVRRVPYRLSAVLAAVVEGETIFVCEGEKDCDNLARLGFVSSCNAGGAESKFDGGKKWLPEFNQCFYEGRVVIIADRDSAGRKHAQIVARHLQPIAESVKVIELPDVGEIVVKDATDFIEAGGFAADLMLLADAAPVWSPVVESIAAVDFPEVTAALRGRIIEVLTDANCKGHARNAALAKAVVESLGQVGRLFWHLDLRDYDSAMFFDASVKRLLRIRSDAFGAWLSDWININRADPLFKFAQAEIETAALAGPDTVGILPEAFWAARPGAIYLSNGDGVVCKITSAGLAMVDNGTDGVLFAAGRTLKPWKLAADPRDAFETCSIFRDLHGVAAHARDLVRLWLYSLPSCPRSKPPLCLSGDIGSGKTRLAKAVTELYGIPFTAQKVDEGAEDDFWPCVDAGGLFIMDNADTKCRWLADALANAATDGCSQRRRLYTNSETVTLRARAWLAVTTANPTFAADSGLADRLLIVRMGRREGEDSSDGALTDEILAARDSGLTHIAQTLRAAIADVAPVASGLNKRHPDFAAFAVRIGRALGREAEAVEALQVAEHDKAEFCLENDPTGAALVAVLARDGAFTGPASELLPKLVEIDSELGDRLTARRLGKRLAALWPHIVSHCSKARRDFDRKGIVVWSFAATENDSLPANQSALL